MNISKEDYLKAIYEQGGDKSKVSNKDIANSLGVSAPSVSEMTKKLLQDGYVEYTSYRGVKLTESGIDEAKKIKRIHLLWEVFLLEILGYDIDEIHDEAEKLEHATSKKLEEKLDKYLNYPKICPHGTEIIRRKNNVTRYRNSTYCSNSRSGLFSSWSISSP